MDILQKSKNKQRRIGLTGGIASGKTTITNYIRKYKNIPILDADNVSRELIKPNTYGYKKILDYFGKKIIDNQVIQFRLSELKTEVELLRSLIYRACENFIQGEDVTLLASMAKLKSGRLIRDCLLYTSDAADDQ